MVDLPLPIPATAAPIHPRRGLGWSIFGFTALVFAPCLLNGFVSWDDLAMIVWNPRFNPPSWAGTGWYWVHAAWNLYQPMTTTLWSACTWAGWTDTPDAMTGHMNPAIFHLASLVLHALTAAAAYAILRRAVCNDISAAVIGTLVFALHPVQVEAVAFAGAMNNPLFGFLGLAAIIAYLRWTDPAGTRSPWMALASCALLLSSMISKPTAVVLVPMAWLLDGLVHRRPFHPRTRSILPWALLAIPCVLWTRAAQHGVATARPPLLQRPLIAADAVAFHLRNLAWPTRLAIDYGRTPTAVLQGPPAHLALAALVTIACIALAILLRRRLPAVSAGLSIYLFSMLPNSGLVPFDSQLISTIADRYAYLPLLGIALIVATAMNAISARWRWIVAAPLLAACIVQTEFQLHTWRDSEHLFRRALAINPQSWLARTNLAYVVAETDPAAAVDLCRQSLAIRADQAVTWNTLGSLLMQMGQRSEGAKALAEAHRLAPDDPLYAASAMRAARSSATTTPHRQ